MDGKEAQVPLCAAPLATQRPNALSPPSGESGGRQTAIVGHPLSQSGQPLLGNGLPLSSDGSQSAAGSPLHLTSSPFSRRMLLLRPPFFSLFHFFQALGLSVWNTPPAHVVHADHNPREISVRISREKRKKSKICHLMEAIVPRGGSSINSLLHLVGLLFVYLIFLLISRTCPSALCHFQAQHNCAVLERQGAPPADHQAKRNEAANFSLAKTAPMKRHLSKEALSFFDLNSSVSTHQIRVE